MVRVARKRQEEGEGEAEAAKTIHVDKIKQLFPQMKAGIAVKLRKINQTD